MISYIYCICFASDKKHARQFDFMAMFEETRKTAIERSQPVLGKCFIFSVYLFCNIVLPDWVLLCLYTISN